MEAGHAALAESIDNPEVAGLGLQYCLGVGFRGVAMVEFKKDDRDGEFKLIELNPRLWSHTNLAIDCGADLPLMQYADLTDQFPSPRMNSRIGVRWLHPIRDIGSFLSSSRGGRLSPWLWFKSWRGVTSHASFAWDDIRPFLRDIRNACQSLWERSLDRSAGP